jgi:hypothetical protein
MNALQYTITAYVVVGGLLWGYATCLFLASRSLKRRESRAGGRS